MHVGGCNGIVAVPWVCGYGNGKREADKQDGDEEADGEVVSVRLCWGKHDEGEEEEGAEDYTEEGEVVWDAEAGSPVY